MATIRTIYLVNGNQHKVTDQELFDEIVKAMEEDRGGVIRLPKSAEGVVTIRTNAIASAVTKTIDAGMHTESGRT